MQKITPCMWFNDQRQFGVSWQVVPTILDALMQDAEHAEKMMNALLKMKKLDIDTLKAATKP